MEITLVYSFQEDKWIKLTFVFQVAAGGSILGAPLTASQQKSVETSIEKLYASGL
jgi:hypothetical protein